MPWFDGTYTVDRIKFRSEFPERIARDLYRSRDRKRLALVNRYKEDDPMYALADPLMENFYHESAEDHVFYHSFFGEEAVHAKRTVNSFLKEQGKKSDGLILFKEDGDDLFTYAHGHICCKLVYKQDMLYNKLPKTGFVDTAFVLPLEVHRYRCPVCGQRTLHYRGEYEICPECYWEDCNGWEEAFDKDYNKATLSTMSDYVSRLEYYRVYKKLKREYQGNNWREDNGKILPAATEDYVRRHPREYGETV